MPKEGFTSLTVREEYAEPLKLVYKKMLLQKDNAAIIKILKKIPDLDLK